ncbi:MAG TPA: hypothetical protein DGG94_10150 [Micromonosporaceae bacterium]|nr:hypothetical protein [Micromonosporaceae bacterium]
MAQEHWLRYRPVEYSQMTLRVAFFRTLGDQIESRIDDRADQLEQLVPADLPFQERMGRMMDARSQAELEVLAEMLPRAEEDETGE